MATSPRYLFREYTTKELEDLCRVMDFEPITFIYGAGYITRNEAIAGSGMKIPFKEIPLHIHKDDLHPETKKVLMWRLTINK